MRMMIFIITRNDLCFTTFKADPTHIANVFVVEINAFNMKLSIRNKAPPG